MANLDDILFRLRTEGDPQGAEQVTEAIKDTGEAAKKTGEQATAADPQLGQLINIQRAQIASQIANALGQVGGAVRGMAADLKTSDKELAKTLEDTATGIDSLTGALGGAAQGFAVGGPFGAAVGGTIGLLSGPLKDAYRDMISDLDAAAESEKRLKETNERLATSRAKFAEQVRQERLTSIYQEQSKEIAEQVRLIEVLSRLQAGGRDAAAAVQAATQPAATPEQQVSRDLANDLGDIDAKVATARRLAAESATLAEQAIQNAALVSASAGLDSALTTEAFAQRDAAVRDRDVAVAKADELAAAAESERQKVRASAVEKLSALGDAAAATITENANDVIRTIQQVAAEQGGRIGNDTKGALDQLTRLVSDLIPDEQQAAAFQQAIQQFRGSQDAIQNKVVGTIDEILQRNRELMASMASRDAEIARQKREIQDSEKRFLEQIGHLQSQLR